MKKLSIEQKAKAYDEALKVLHKYDGANIMFSQSLKEEMFPELKEESEDERIKHEIKVVLANTDLSQFALEYTFADMLTWLEKQGEQPQGKSALEAAKEEKVDNANKVEPRQEELSEFEKAVKQVMEEAIECGDTHNLKADADMLLSLVQKPAWSEKDEEMLDSIIEEVRYIGDFPDYPTKEENELYDECLVKVEWLKSLKDRVQPQQKQEWSEEDESLRRRCIGAIDMANLSDYTKDSLLNWLKYLSPQNRWKPSDEQMEALHSVIYIKELSYYGGLKDILLSFYNQLKKLK